MNFPINATQLLNVLKPWLEYSNSIVVWVGIVVVGIFGAYQASSTYEHKFLAGIASDIDTTKIKKSRAIKKKFGAHSRKTKQCLKDLEAFFTPMRSDLSWLPTLSFALVVFGVLSSSGLIYRYYASNWYGLVLWVILITGLIVFCCFIFRHLRLRRNHLKIKSGHPEF